MLRGVRGRTGDEVNTHEEEAMVAGTAREADVRVTFSCRAECDIDALEFFRSAHLGAAPVWVERLVRLPDDPGILVEFSARGLDVEGLRVLMREVEDSHVMRQTLRACPLAANSLERDWDVE